MRVQMRSISGPAKVNANGVGQLKAANTVALLRLRPVELLLQRADQNAQHLPRHVILRCGEELHGAVGGCRGLLYRQRVESQDWDCPIG